MSSSLGAMGSFTGKLRLLLVSSKNQLPDPLKDEIKLLIEELEETRTFLVDLSGAESPMVKLWRNEVREMSYDMEDCIDKTTHPGSNQFEAEEFRVLVDLARDACKSYYRYHLGRLPPSNPSFMAGGGRGHTHVQSLNREATYIVGMDDSKHKLISSLRDSAEQRLKVVPILGPAGAGKTTLAQEVYREIGREFECRAFVWASRMTDTRRLLWSIISQIQRHQRPSYNYTVQELIDNLNEHLQHKRYFIVIDGLWETSSWDTINSAFPMDNCCSRVLITTDIEEVALEFTNYQPNSIFQIEPLSTDYSADLLNNRVSDYKPELTERIKENLEDIIRTCCGLPLAIISIANILENQVDNSQLWCQVKEYISSRLRNNLTPEGILREIVGLSYDCLSHELKLCLLYLGVYPEGYTFLKADLLKQWIAEGFINAVQEDVNEVAESYFDDLVCKGLIQPYHINFSNMVMSYTVHSTMFEVIRYKSVEENFTTVIDYSHTIPELSTKVRRLSLRYSNAKYATKPEGLTLSSVRSLIFYGFVDCLPSVTEFEVLRVLNLEFWGGKEELDLSGINQLFQLRYMRIATDITVKLPAEMKGLQYLETLEIYSRVISVPSDIVHLTSLLHLCLLGEIKFSDGISHMKSLRTLHSFDLSSNSEDNVWRLGEMTDLHDLHLTCSKSMSDSLEKKLIALACSIGKLGKLKSFILAPDTSCCNIYSDCSGNMSCPPVSIQRLEFLPPVCIFSRLPKWFEQLRKLCVLKIVVRELTRDDVDTIAGLQELTILSLFVRQPSTEKIAFNRAAFPVLKYFKYRCGILRLAFHAETMPSLETLKLEFNAHNGNQYDDMLTGIENLSNLQEVAGRIGAIPGAEESDKQRAESAFMDAIIKHSKLLTVNVQRVDWADQETSQFSMQSAALDEQPSRLSRDHVTDVVSEVSASVHENVIYNPVLHVSKSMFHVFIVGALLNLIIVPYSAGSFREVDTTVYVNILIGAFLVSILIEVVTVNVGYLGEAILKSSAWTRLKGAYEFVSNWLREKDSETTSNGRNECDERQRTQALENELVENWRRGLFVFAILVATITYQAAVIPPSGFRLQDDKFGHRYKAFFYCNSVSFMLSIALIILLVNKNLYRSAIRSNVLSSFRTSIRLRSNVLSVCTAGMFGLVGAYAAGSMQHSIYIFTLALVSIDTLIIASLVPILIGVVTVNVGYFGEAILKSSGWTRLKVAYEFVSNWMREKDSETSSNGSDGQQRTQELGKACSLVLLLATLAATLTYHAGLNPPGGLWQEDGEGHMAVGAVLLTRNLRWYKAFYYCNWVAFVASLVAIILVGRKTLHRHNALEAAMIRALFGLIGAYVAVSCLDVNTPIYAMALAGNVLVCLGIHIVALDGDTRGGNDDEACHEDDGDTRGGNDGVASRRRREQENEVVEKQRKRLLLLAILAATITYQAGLNLLSGFRLQDDDKSGHRGVDPVLLYIYLRRYKAFFYGNSVSFMLSIVLILLLVNKNLYRPAVQSNMLSICTVAGMFGLVVAYVAGSMQHFKVSIYIALAGVVLVPVALLVLVFLVIHKKGHQEHRSSASASASAADEENGTDLRNKYLMLLGVLVASVTYQAGLGLPVPPGGVWQSDDFVHAAGNPIMHDNRYLRYLAFFYGNSISFVASLLVIILLLLESLQKQGWWLTVMNVTIRLDLIGLLISYAAWKISGYVSALVIAVLGYLVIDVMLSCFTRFLWRWG